MTTSREPHGDAQPTRVPGGNNEGSVVGAGDALDDRQAEADPGAIRVGPFDPTLERLGEGGHVLVGERRAGVLDREDHSVGVHAGRDPHRATVGQVVDDPVVHEVRGQLQQERV